MAKILLGVTGGIAAYKSPDLVRRLRDAGHQVKVVLTKRAKAFVTPLSLQAVSGEPVRSELMDSAAEAAMGHIELARWAEVILIAPASANIMAQLAHGFANDLLSTLCLASEAPIILAPAMNRVMWQAPATQENLAILQRRGIRLLGPAAGSQACGEVGLGRMLEPMEIVQGLNAVLVQPYLAGKKLLITAGPTQEPIDPVRFLTNRSSGKMGYALAQAAVQAGAKVTLVSGPVNVPLPVGVKLHRVKTAEQMYQAVMANIAEQDIVIASAAVADYRVKQMAEQKIKKSEDTMQLELVKNVDILAQLGRLPNKPFLVGFAAETENLIEHAKQKLINKNLDMVIANDVSQAGIGFDADDNAVMVVTKDGATLLNKMPKTQLAVELLQLIAKYL
jgi:phosphopantothenoylcysteine decarboxylase/phosphopantothenate--cysteine ligase